MGVVPYTAALNGGAPQNVTGNTHTFNGLFSGSHSIYIADNSGCFQTLNVTVGSSGTLNVTSTTTPTSCIGAANGSITVNPQNGVAPFQYKLNGGPFQSSNTFNGVPAGTHTVIVKDASGCQSSFQVTVANGPGITASFTSNAPSCGGVNNGSVTITPNNGTAPYLYNMNGGPYQSSNTFTGLTSGTYMVNVIDASGCQILNMVTWVGPGGALTATATSTSTSCAGVSNGSITITPTSGSGPYQYSLNGGAYQSSNIFTTLAPGNYSVVVKDGAGCLSNSISVSVAAGGSLLATAATTATSCNGATNGSITVTPTNGAGPYQYSLNGTPAQSSNIFNGVSAGNHTIVVTDGAGCVSAPINVTVAAGAALTATASATPTSCSGATNGTVTVTPTNGNSPYQYSLNGGTYQSSNTFTGLAAGNYTVVMRDAAGCQTNSINVVVSPGQPLAATTTVSNVKCNAANDGSVTVSLSVTGTPPYQYSLDNITYQSSNIFNGLAAGSYTVYFRDNNNCTGTQTFTITQPTVLSATVNTQPVKCNGASDGSITVTATGGTAPYQYSINGTAYQASNSFNVAAGNYTVYIKDNNNCIKTQTVTITEPAILSASSVTTNASCDGGNDGRITITANGGTANYQYSIDGINFQASNVFNVAPGNYSVTTKDANSCTTVQNIIVGLSNNLTITPALDLTICEGTMVALAATSNATQYSWSPSASLTGANSANPVASPRVTTQYIVTATLGRCSADDTLIVNVHPAPIADAGANGDICFGQNYQLQGSGGISFEWSPSTFLSSTTVSNPNVTAPDKTIQYTLFVTDANGCRSLQPDMNTVNVTPPIVVKISKDTIVALGDQFLLHASSAATNYLWTPATGLNDATIPDPLVTVKGDITYKVTATTPAGCKGEAFVTLKVYKGPELYVPTAFTPNNDGKNDKFFPFPVGIKSLNYFRVYNRWGQIIFSTNTLFDGWDGTVNGKPQASGAYVWMAEGFTKDDKIITKKGTVMVIR